MILTLELRLDLWAANTEQGRPCRTLMLLLTDEDCTKLASGVFSETLQTQLIALAQQSIETPEEQHTRVTQARQGRTPRKGG